MKQFSIMHFLFLLVLFFCIGAMDVYASESTSLVAEGDGFVITNRDVEAIEAYMQREHDFVSSNEQHVKVTVQIYLFAEEGKRIGIKPKYRKGEKDVSEFAQLIGYFMAYKDYVLENYVFDDIVIESYYLSHPKWISEESGNSYLLPLDDLEEKYITYRLMKLKKGYVILDEFKRLMQKYQVRIIQGESN
ncbi:MAG: hypothetical protein JXL81_12120 [Deltaproteobacteria bacterium]|nr:hypothetical protein [Deltaproteobacteria bacterium]